MNNIYQTTAENLWQYPIGSVVSILGKSYMYVSKDEWTNATLYSYDTGLTIEIESLTPEDSEEYASVIVGPVDLAKLLLVKMAGCLALVQDGWTIGSKGLDIAPYIEELKTLKAIHDIMSSGTR